MKLVLVNNLPNTYGHLWSCITHNFIINGMVLFHGKLWPFAREQGELSVFRWQKEIPSINVISKIKGKF